MALIGIVLSSIAGLVFGIVQFAFLDVSLGHAVMSYFGVSLALSAIILTSATVSTRTNRAAHDEEGPSLTTLENWQDWQTEEEMEAERLRVADEGSLTKLPAARRSA